MRTSRTALLVAVVALAAHASPGWAQDRAQDGAQDRAQTRVVVHQQLIALLNPMGAQHTARLGVRSPLGDQDALLFGGAHAEAGVVSYLAPVFAIQGGYLEVSPLSFLVLNAEMTGAAVWPIGMDGAGYYGLGGYDDADVVGQTLAADRGASATGWGVRLGAQLQGAIPLGDVRLLLVDGASFNHESMGGASHYYNLRYDLVLAQQDWVLENDAYLLGEGRLASDVVLRAGAFDNLRYVFGSGYVGNQVGAIAAVTFEDVDPRMPGLSVYVRGAYYTHHVSRQDELTVLGGLSIDYDLGGIQ